MVTVTVAVLSVMLASACGGAAGPPEHFTRVETGWMTIDIPEGWVPVEAGEPWTQAYADTDDDSATVMLAISPTYSESNTANGAAADIIASAQFTYPQFQVVPSAEGTNDDFNHFSQTRFTYSGSDGQALEGVIWGVADDAQRAVVVQLTGENLGDDLVTTIGKSIKIVKD